MSFPIRALTRVVIELDGPCSVGTGDGSHDSDSPFVTSAIGLPTLPGSSLAGLLRASMGRLGYGDDDTRHWFGFQDRDGGEASRVRLSWGHIHDERDRPVDERRPRDRWSPFLQAMAMGELRDHVSISHLGAAADNKKFDRLVVHGGARFTFDLEIVARDGERDEVVELRAALLSALQAPWTRLGARKHSGLGAFHVVSARSDVFDLRERDDFDRYRRLSPRLDGPFELPALDLRQLATPAADDLARVRLEISPETFFLIGGGDIVPTARGEKGPDMASVRCRRVEWSRAGGKLSDPMFYLPGTSLKGAISHRVAYHYNRLAGRWAEDSDDLAALCGEANPAVQELFGFCKGAPGEDDSDGQIGRLIVEDVVLDAARTRELIHVSIDPFTGGTKTHFLFTEEVLCPDERSIALELGIESPATLSPHTLEALRLALQDLVDGRLALGGGYGRGNGHFRGTLEWPATLNTKTEVAA